MLFALPVCITALTVTLVCLVNKNKSESFTILKEDEDVEEDRQPNQNSAMISNSNLNSSYNSGFVDTQVIN
jgi:hypothetical protein